MDPIDTLIRLDEALIDLDTVQSWIDDARIAAPRNQHVQLELDRRQAEVDRKRVWIAVCMADIRSRN